MSKLKFFNSLNNKKEEFIPVDEHHIRVYACGPTVYNYAHVGNARMAVVFDVVVRLLRYIYPKVTYVSNITDIDDKIIEKSIQENVNFLDITKKYTEIYNNDMRRLNVNRPDIQPLATNFIKSMIEKIQYFENNNYAYSSNQHVLFNVEKFKKYGSLSNRSKEEQLAGSRIKVASYKKNAEDFILWKPSKDNEPGWNSPWGFGRPGWHTECFAMCEEILGTPFDIHGGGLDLKFPHHDNELAQSCCFTGELNNLQSFAKYWMHNGFVTINNQKMSKSLGNIKLIRDYLSKFKEEVIRLSLLSSHYRSPLLWNLQLLEQSENILNKFYKFLASVEEVHVENIDNFDLDVGIRDALFDDLNLSKVFAELNTKLIQTKKNNSMSEKIKLKRNILSTGNILGIFMKDPASWFENENNVDKLDTEFINKIIYERLKAKKNKNFKLADRLREKLLDIGIEISDNKSGTEWKKGNK